VLFLASADGVSDWLWWKGKKNKTTERKSKLKKKCKKKKKDAKSEKSNLFRLGSVCCLCFAKVQRQ